MKNMFMAGLTVLFWGTLANAQPPPTVPEVDLEQYVGKWYEIASIPQSFQKDCVGNTTAEYSFAERGRIRVINSCDTATGNRKVAEGRAKVVERPSNSKLKVTFVKLIDWVFAFGGDYWILDLANDYSFVLIGHPDRSYAWILSRTPSIDMDLLIAMEMRYKDLGYDTCKILTSLQDSGLQTRVPLCELKKH